MKDPIEIAFQAWFDGYSNVDEPSSFDGFKAGWRAALRAYPEQPTAPPCFFDSSGKLWLYLEGKWQEAPPTEFACFGAPVSAQTGDR